MKTNTFINSSVMGLAILAVTFCSSAERCPFCGGEYGGGPSTSGDYLARIRRDHEATCPARGTGGGSYDPTRWRLNQSRNLIAQGNLALDRRDYRTAIRYYQEALDLKTSNDSIARGNIEIVKKHQAGDFIESGNRAYAQKDYWTAIRLYESALAFKTSDDSVALGNIEKARAAIREDARFKSEQEQWRLEQANRQAADAWYEQARTAWNNKQYRDAERYIQKADDTFPDPFFKRALADVRGEMLMDDAWAAYSQKDYEKARDLARRAASASSSSYYSDFATRAEAKLVMQKETRAMAEERKVSLKKLASAVGSGNYDGNFDTAGLDAPGLKPTGTAFFGQGGGSGSGDSTVPSTVARGQAGGNGTDTAAGNQLLAASKGVANANEVVDGAWARNTGGLQKLNLQGMPKNVPRPLDTAKLPASLVKDAKRFQEFKEQNDSRNKAIEKYVANLRQLEELNYEKSRAGAKFDSVREVKIKEAENNMDQATADISFRNLEIKRKFSVDVTEQ